MDLTRLCFVRCRQQKASAAAIALHTLLSHTLTLSVISILSTFVHIYLALLSTRACTSLSLTVGAVHSTTRAISHESKRLWDEIRASQTDNPSFSPPPSFSCDKQTLTRLRHLHHPFINIPSYPPRRVSVITRHYRSALSARAFFKRGAADPPDRGYRQYEVSRPPSVAQQRPQQPIQSRPTISSTPRSCESAGKTIRQGRASSKGHQGIGDAPQYESAGIELSRR